MTAKFNDSLDNLFEGDTGPVRTVPVRTALDYKPVEERFFERCSRCRGTGQTPWGICFRCKGSKGKTFKTNAATREKNRAGAADRKANREAEILQAWIDANPAEHAWLIATAPRWDVAASLLAGLQKYGDLTEKQLAMVRNGMARDAARAAERAAKAISAPVVDGAGIDRLKVAFDHAVAYAADKGLKMKTPKITIGGITISPAGANSKNPGALYVKESGTYLGKVAAGQFHAMPVCSPATQTKILEFIADPQAAAVAYGQTTGECCLCGAVLKSKWKHLGIGPICSQKFGW